jgi:hypothetical protein
VSTVRSIGKASAATSDVNALHRARGCLSASGEIRSMYSSSIVIVAGFWLFLERLGFMRSQIIYYLGTTIVPTYMYLSLYRPKPWTEFCPRFASKMGTYVSRNVSLTTEFACTYLRKQYQNHVRSPKWREIQTTPETGLHGM